MSETYYIIRRDWDGKEAVACGSSKKKLFDSPGEALRSTFGGNYKQNLKMLKDNGWRVVLVQLKHIENCDLEDAK